MQVKERTFSVSNMIFFTFNSQQYFKYFDFIMLRDRRSRHSRADCFCPVCHSLIRSVWNFNYICLKVHLYWYPVLVAFRRKVVFILKTHVYLLTNQSVFFNFKTQNFPDNNRVSDEKDSWNTITLFIFRGDVSHCRKPC